MKIWKLTSLIILMLICGCTDNSIEESATLAGVWLAPIETGGFQGYQFDPDGRVHFLNMLSISGDRWERTGEKGLNISSHTDHYPKPATGEMLIKELKAESLVLVPVENPKASGSSYQRFVPQSPADTMVGRWSNSTGTFFDITPAGQGYRVVFKWPEGVQTLNGESTDQGMTASRDGKTLLLTLAPGPGSTGYCLHIDGLIFSCRSGI